MVQDEDGCYQGKTRGKIAFKLTLSLLFDESSSVNIDCFEIIIRSNANPGKNEFKLIFNLVSTG